ncbi:hypothetical protein Tco_0689399 [Tanacetum coccineum]
MVTLVDGVLASGVVMIFEMDIASYAIQGTKILSLMIQLRILSIILPIFHTHPYNPNTCHTLVSYVGTMPIKVISLAWETILEIEHAFEDKQYQPESILENRPTIYYDDDDDKDYTITIAPVLSTEEPDNSLSMGDEHLDTVLATESDEVIKSSVEILILIPSESKGIPDKMCDVPFRDNSPPLDISKDQFEGFSDSNDDSTSIDDDSFSIDDIDYIEDDILCEKLSKINLLIAKIEAVNSNPTPSSDFLTKSSSTSLNFFLEETNTFDNSIPVSENFYFDLEENSSGSSTTRSDYSLSDYEAFYFDDDHIEEKCSGSTTTHSDISLSKYDSFIFDLLNDPFPPADRSDFYHEEFADELAHIISPPEYDCFYFKSEPDPGELTSIVDSGIRENVLSMTNVSLPFEDNQSPLLEYVVWIFLLFLTYPITPLYFLSYGNEDTIFDPGISIYHSFMPIDFSDCDDSRARCFVLRSVELHILSFIWESNILILSTNVYL